MQVIINRNALLEVLNVASGIVASRTTKEVLRCVRLSTVKDALLLAATDLEIGLRVEVKQVEIKSKGEMLVPAEKLMQIARESLDETLTLEVDGDICHIRGRDSHFQIFGQNPKEFPPVAELEGTPDVELDVVSLTKLIEQTIFAVAKENTRYAINGILWEKQPKKLAMVATDGRRLVRTLRPVKQSVGEDVQAIVPAKTVQVLQRILHSVEDSVAIRFTSNQVVIKAGEYVLSSALVEGRFPNYDEVIPKDSDRKVELPTEEFLSAVKRAALLTNEQSKGVRLAFGKETLVLSSRAPEQGEATISMRIQYDASPLEIGFNPAFLVDALRIVDSPSVVLELKEPNRPAVLRVGQEFMYVVMPVNLS